MLRHLPNALSILRLVLAPYIAWLLIDRHFSAALLWLIFAAITDALDGYLARRFGWHSHVGVWLDPVADKALLSLCFLALGIADVVPLWFVALVAGRDLLILACSALVLKITSVRELPPTIWGKISTVFQSFFIVYAVGRSAGVMEAPWLHTPLLAAAVAGTVWSGLHYGWTGLRLLRAAV